MSIIKSDEISVSEYLKRFEQNASQSWTQKLTPVSATKSSWQFNFSSPGYDCLMHAQVFLETEFSLECSANLTDPEAAAQIEMLGKREGYPLTKAMRSCALTVNGQSISYKPSTFIYELTYLNVGKSQSGKVCAPLMEPLDPIFSLVNENGANVQNRSMLAAEPAGIAIGSGGFKKGGAYLQGSFAKRLKEFLDKPRAAIMASQANRSKRFTFYEPVFMPICNFFGDVKYETLSS